MEKQEGGKIKKFFFKLRNTVVPVFVYGGAVGAVVGVIVTFFNMGAEWLTANSSKIYDWFYSNPYYIPLLFLCLAAFALIMALVHSRVPEVRGSGVPQTEGVMRGFFSFRKLKVFLATIFLSFISFFCGLPLGSEGPSIQVGAATAAGTAHALKTRLAWRRYLISAGAGAGLAVAFNAPLTGLVFVLEEGQRKFTATMLFTCSAAIVSATLVYRALRNAIFGAWENHVLFDLSGISLDYTDFNIYWMLLILGVIVGVCAILFNVLLIRTQRVTDKWGKKFPYWARLLVTFLIVGAVGLIPAVKGAIFGGSTLIKDLYAQADMAWYIIMAVLIVKFLLILLCYNSGATGGLFVPMLALGALIGALAGKAFIAAGMSETYYPVMVCVGMTAFFAASVRTPITAAVLIVEITGYSLDFLPAIVAIFAAYVAAELSGNRPIYDSMLDRYLRNNGLDRKRKLHRLEIDVEEGSFIVGRYPVDIMWEHGCRIRGIYRGEELVLPDDGETRIKGGDVLVLEIMTDDLDASFRYLYGLVTNFSVL